LLSIQAISHKKEALVFGVLAEYGLSPDPQSTDADLEDTDADLEDTDADLEDIEGSYIRAGGLFELIEDTQGQLLGAVGLYSVDAQTGELRKIYLAPHARGRGLGSAILKRTIVQARDLGF
jgi:putative acetyltransferase